MTKATEEPPRRSRGRPSRRRSELERLLDVTVLGPTPQSWGPAGGSPGRPRPTGASPRRRTATPTGSAGSSSAAQFPRARSSTTAAVSTPAGTRIIWSPSRMPRTNGGCGGRTANMVIRCRVTICGSAPTGYEPVGRATRQTSGRYVNVKPRAALTPNAHRIHYVDSSPTGGETPGVRVAAGRSPYCHRLRGFRSADRAASCQSRAVRPSRLSSVETVTSVQWPREWLGRTASPPPRSTCRRTGPVSVA
jgi:hypothetical protein